MYANHDAVKTGRLTRKELCHVPLRCIVYSCIFMFQDECFGFATKMYIEKRRRGSDFTVDFIVMENFVLKRLHNNIRRFFQLGRLSAFLFELS